MKILINITFALLFTNTCCAIEHPITTRVKQDIVEFCTRVGNGCFDEISAPFHSGPILFASRNPNSTDPLKNPCARQDLAEKLIKLYGNEEGALELAERMSNAPINVIPPDTFETLGLVTPCLKNNLISTSENKIPNSFECINNTTFRHYITDKTFVLNDCPKGMCFTRKPPIKNPCIGEENARRIDKNHN